MSDQFRRKENGEAEMIFMQHYASASNDYMRSQQSQQSSGDLSYSANGSNNLQQMKTFADGASPNNQPSQFQSPSTNKSPFHEPIMTYTGQKDGFVFHNGVGGSTVASAAQSRYGGTIQYSGGLMNSNENSNRLLKNFLTESGVSPLSTTAGKNYRHMEDDQFMMNGEMMGMSLQSTEQNVRRKSDSKERTKEKIYNQLYSQFAPKQAPNSNSNPYIDGRNRQQIISVLPGNHDDTNKISEQSGHFGQPTKHPPRHGRVQTAIGIDYSDNASSPLRYLQQRNGFDRSDNSGFTNKTVSPYAGMDQLKQALLSTDPRGHKQHLSNKPQNNDWLDKARRQSRDKDQQHEQEMLDQRLRKIQAHAANQMKHQIQGLNRLPKTIIDEPSIHSQQPSMSSSQSQDKLETNSLIELEDQINRKKDRVFKQIEQQCAKPTRNDSGLRLLQERKQKVPLVNQNNHLQPFNKLTQAVVGDPGCFYQDKLTALRQKIQSIQNRQTAVNQSHVSNTHKQKSVNRSHISGTSKVQFDPLNFQAMEAGTSPFRSSAISPTRQHTLHTSRDMSRNLHMGTIQTDAGGEQEFQFFSVNQIEAIDQAEEKSNAGQKSDIRQKIQNLKDKLNRPVQKPPLKNETQVSIQDIQNSRFGKRSAPIKMPIRPRSVCEPRIDSQNITSLYNNVTPCVAASMNTTQTTRRMSEKQINIDIQKSNAKQAIHSSLRVKRPSSVASHKYEPIEPVKAQVPKRQKSKDQQDRIRGLISERKKNKLVMEELQLQIENLNERMSQAEKKSSQNAHFGKHKIKELITEVENLQDIVVKYKKKEVKLKKKLHDEVGGGKQTFKKKRMSQTIQKPIRQHIEALDQERHFKTISTEKKTKTSKYAPIVRKSYQSQSIPNRSPVSPKMKYNVKSAAQLNPYSISIHSKSHSISPVNKNLMKQLGQSELALKRECCQKALAQNMKTLSKSRSRSVERKYPLTDQVDSHIVIKKITSNTTPPTKSTFHILQQNAKHHILTNPSLISNADKPQSVQVDSHKKQPNKAQRERQRQPNSQRKQSLQAVHKDLAHNDLTQNGFERNDLDEDVMTLTAKEMQQQQLIETLQEQLRNAKVEKEEWKQKSKKLAQTFLETLRGLKENLFAVRDEAQNDLEIAKDDFEQRLDYLSHLIDQRRNPWENNSNNLGSTDKIPTQLSPRIRGDQSQGFSKSNKRLPQKQSNDDLQLDDSPYHKQVLILNQESSNSNFHQGISHSIEVSEKQLMHRNTSEKNTFDEPDFA